MNQPWITRGPNAKLNPGFFWGGGAVGGGMAPADYVVTTDAEWATVFANSDATLSGKIVEVSGTNFTVRSIGGRTFSPKLTIRSANASSKLPGLAYTGNITGLHLVDLNIQVTGWPATNPCIDFGIHDFTDYQEIRGTRRHGYGPTQLNFVTDFVYPEYARPNHVGTATTTSVAVAITWTDPARSSGWIEFWNNGAAIIYVKGGTDGTVVATAADTACAPGVRTRLSLGPANTHLAVLAASGTVDYNFKAEIGMSVYLADAYSSGGGASITDGRFIGVNYSDLSNGIKFLPDLLGKTVFMDIRTQRIYQDVCAHGWAKSANDELLFLRNTLCQPFCLSGIDTNGDARDPHGDLLQLFQESVTGRVYAAGNRCLREPLRTGAGNQGAHYWVGNGGFGYNDCYVIGDLLLLNSQNGITISGPSIYSYVYGSTVFNPESPIGTSGGQATIAAAAGSNSFIGDCILNQIVTATTKLGRDGNHLLNGGAITDRFTNFADLFTATTVGQLESALTESGAAAGKGAVAKRNVIDWATTDPDLVIKWSLLPSGVVFPARVDLARSTLSTTDIRKVLGGPATMNISVGAGTEYQVTSDLAGLTVVTAWTTTAGTIAKGNFLQLRGTTSASYATPTTLSATINGFATSVIFTTEEDPALMFTTAAGGPGFTDTVNTVTGSTSKFTTKARFRVTTLTGTQTIFTIHNGPVFIGEILSSGAVRITVRDSALTQIAQVSSAGGTISAGQWATVVASVDLATLTLRCWVNGTIVIDAALAANTGTFGSSRKLHFLRNGAGTNRLVGNVLYCRAWKDEFTGDGSDPATATYVDIVGPAATANAHPWKVDADAT